MSATRIVPLGRGQGPINRPRDGQRRSSTWALTSDEPAPADELGPAAAAGGT